MRTAKEVGTLLQDGLAVRALMLFQRIVSARFAPGWWPAGCVLEELLVQFVELTVEKFVKQLPRDDFLTEGVQLNLLLRHCQPAAVLAEIFAQQSAER